VKVQDLFTMDGVPTQVTSTIIACVTPFVMFFKDNSLFALMGLLLLDFMTGLHKAKVLNRVASTRLADAFDRLFYYILVYGILHLLALTLPTIPGLEFISVLPESAVMAGFMLKETLSVFENVLATRKALGQESPLLQSLVTRIGMDLERIDKEIANGAPNPPAGPNK
jgi:hypothetical protein